MKATKRILSAVMALLMVLGMFSCLGTVAGAYLHENGTNWDKAFDKDQEYSIKSYSELNATYGSDLFMYIGVEFFELTPDAQAKYDDPAQVQSLDINDPSNWELTDHYVQPGQPLKARVYQKANGYTDLSSFEFMADNKFFDINDVYVKTGVLTDKISYDDANDKQINSKYIGTGCYYTTQPVQKTGLPNYGYLGSEEAYDNGNLLNTVKGFPFNANHPVTNLGSIDIVSMSYGPAPVNDSGIFHTTTKTKGSVLKGTIDRHNISDLQLLAYMDSIIVSMTTDKKWDLRSDEWMFEYFVSVRDTETYNSVSKTTVNYVTDGTVGHFGMDSGLFTPDMDANQYQLASKSTADAASIYDSGATVLIEDANHTFIIGTPGAAAPAVTYAAGDGSFAQGFTTKVDAVEGKVTLSDGTGVNAPSGKVITGWTDGTNTYGLGETIDVTADINLTAVYGDAGFTATFYDGATKLDLDIQGTGTITLPAAISKNGYRFNGWNDGTTTYAASASYDLTANKQFTADFAKLYNATFIGEKGTKGAQYAANDTIVFPEADLAVTGKHITGWTVDGSAAPTVMPAANTTFTAVYANDVHKVNYYINNNFYTDRDVEYGAAIENIVPDDLGAGVQFNGWNYTFPATMGTEDINIYGTTSAAKCTVTFKYGALEGNKVYLTSDPVDYNTVTISSILPEDPEVTGYQFVAWTYEDGGEIGDDDKVCEDLTLVATWEICKHAVSIVVDGKDAYLADEKEFGSSITKAELDALAEDEGLTVDGKDIVWKLVVGDDTVDVTLPYEIEEDGTDDIIFSGEYVAKKYDITFFKKEGEVVQKIDEATGIDFEADITAIIANAAKPTKTGWTFADWTLEDGTAFTATTMPAEDVELYSIGTQKVYTEKWIDNLDGDKVVKEINDAHYGDAIVPPEVPKHDGYKDLYWTPAKNTHDVDGDIEFHLGYNAGSSNYTIITKLEKLDGTYEESSVIASGTTGTTATLTGSQISKRGYVLDNDNSVLSGTIKADGSLELVATFKRALVNVTVVDDGKEGDAKTITTQVKYGTEASNPTPAGKTGYTPTGFTWANKNGTIAAPATYEEDVTVTVVYTINKYNVNVFVDGTKDTKLSKTGVVYDTAVPTISEPAAKEGYEFDGWYTDPEYKTKYEQTNMPAADLDLYGKYDIQSYNVKFVADGKTVKEETLEYGKTITKPADPVKTGYEFKGWKGFVETVPANDVTFVADLQKKTYTVKFYVGEDVVKTSVTEFEAVPAAPEKDPVKTGYKFIGWNPEVTAITEDVDGEIAYEAQFKIQKFDAVFYKNEGDAQAYDIQNVEFNAKIEKPEDPKPASEFEVFMGWKVLGATDVATDADFVMNTEGKTFVAKWAKDASKCVVQSVERVTTPYYGRGAADYKITLAPTYRADKIFIYDGSKTQTYSKGTFEILNADSGVKSITVENDCEIWVVENVLAAASDKYQAYCQLDDGTKETLETAMKFDVVYDTKTEDVQKAEIIDLTFGGETNIIRGEYRTWTVKTSTDVKWLKFDGTYTTADGTENVASTCYKWNTTSSNVQVVDNGNERTWTISMRFTYVADDEKVNQNWVLSYRVGNSAEWNVYGVKNVDVVVGRNEASFVEPTVGYDKYTLVSAAGPETTVTKGKYANFTIVTTDDCDKVRVGFGGKYSTYQASSTNTISCTAKDGLKTWVIKYKFATAGTADYTIQTRGTAWGDAKTVSVTVA